MSRTHSHISRISHVLLGSLAACLALALSLVLAACGSSTEVTLGSASDDAVCVEVTNGTGQDISDLQYKVSSASSWSGNMILAGQTFASDGVAKAYFDIEQAAASESGAAVTVYCDLQLTLADGTIAIIQQLPLASMKSCTLCIEDGVAYADYVDTEGNEVDGAAYAQDVQKRLAEEAAAQAANEAAAAAEAAAESVDSGSVDYSADTSVSQEKQGCLS